MLVEAGKLRIGARRLLAEAPESGSGPSDAIAGAPGLLVEPSAAGEYGSFTGVGAGEVLGEALLTRPEGGVTLAVGGRVTVDPATRYARRVVRRLGAEVARFEAPAPDLQRGRVMGKPGADSGVLGGVVAGLVTVGTVEPKEFVLGRVYGADSTASLALAMVRDAERWAARGGPPGAAAVGGVAGRERGFGLTGGRLSGMVCEGEGW